VDQRKLDVVTTFDVGTASVNWGFDPLYTWVKTPTFAHMLDEMALAGYNGTEISYNFPVDAGEVLSALEQRKLRAAATFLALDLRDTANHDAALRSVSAVADRLHALGSDVLILSDLPTPGRLAVAGRVSANGSDGLNETQWRAMADGLKRIGELLVERGMRGVFHPHVGTFVETRSEIDQLCSATDPSTLGLCPDTGHLAYAGVSSVELFRDYAGRIGYVHLKDVDGDLLARVRADGVDFVRAVELGLFTELGKGIVAIRDIMDSLVESGYHGWLIVEQDAPRDPLGAALSNRKYLREEFGL
jgi:inosose dehydratase